MRQYCCIMQENQDTTHWIDPRVFRVDKQSCPSDFEQWYYGGDWFRAALNRGYIVYVIVER